jgi:putative peptidoglycan lipid II flippase
MAKNIVSIVFGNIFSKVVGLLREILFAAWFGTGEIASAFRIAQTGYLLPTQALVGDSLSAGLLPLYKKLKQSDEDEPRLLVLIAAVYGLLFSAVVTTLLFLYSESVAHFIAPGASSTALNLASDLLKIMSLATPFFVLSGMLSYVEAAYGKYGAIAWRPVLLNIGSIGGAAIAVWTHMTHWLATGILLSHILFFAWTLNEFRKLDNLMPENGSVWRLLGELSKRFLMNMLPLIGLPLIAQVNVLVERVVSSWMGTDVIPSVDYARFLADTTVQLIAMPLGILTMAKHGGSDNSQSQQHILDATLLIMLLSFPIAAFIGLNAESIVRLMFARGAFDQHSVAVTASILRWMGGCLGATVTAYYLIKALNSQLRNVEALVFTVIACGGNMLVNLLAWSAFGAQTVGLAVATYSTILLVLSVRALGIFSKVLPLVFWLLLGCAIQVMISLNMNYLFRYPFDLLANAALAVVIWMSILLLVKPVKVAASPLLMKMPAKIRNLIL